MMKPYTVHRVLLLLALVPLLHSCIKSEPENQECDILEAWIADEGLAPLFYHPSDMRIGSVPSDRRLLTFTVKPTLSLPPVAVSFRLTDGATVTPASGSLQDFSQGPVTYTVTSEDGQWQRRYEVELREPALPVSTYDFEHRELSANGRYYVWYEQGDDGVKRYVWASGNEGYLIARPNTEADDYPTAPCADGYDGQCVRLTTCSTGTWGRRFRKPIAAGNLFLGVFDSDSAFTNTLKTTLMGVPYAVEPVRIGGYYKYQPGDVFTDKEFRELPTRQDEASIYAVLYLNHDASGSEVVLHGDDVLSSPLIVSKAQVAALPPCDTWQRFDMIFEPLSPIDPDLLARRGYNLALVFSSSKTGDTFEGAVGSTLYIDKVDVKFVDPQSGGKEEDQP